MLGEIESWSQFQPTEIWHWNANMGTITDGQWDTEVPDSQ
jgi:hypothetical protein